MVDEILDGFSIRGLNFSSGFYDSLPSISEEEREDMDLELERSLHHGPSEVLRLLERGSPGDGSQHVLDHKVAVARLAAIIAEDLKARDISASRRVAPVAERGARELR